MAQGVKGTKTLVPIENAEQRRAFEYYVELGEERTLAKVTQHTKRHFNTIQAWSKKYGWVQRSKNEDADKIDSVAVESIKQQLEMRRMLNDGFNLILKSAFQFDKDGNVIGYNINVKTASELAKILELKNINLYGQKEQGKSGVNQTQNIDKAVFIIKK